MFFRKKSKQKPGRTPLIPHRRGAGVYSYYASRSRLNESTNRSAGHSNAAPAKGKKIRALMLLLTFIGFALIFSGFFYASTLTTQPRIVQYADKTPNLLRDSKMYQEALNNIFSESLLNRSKLSINSREIEFRIKRQFPELQAVAVKVPMFGRHPVVELQPADPELIVVGAGGKYVIGIDGKALVEYSKTKEAVLKNIPVVIDESGLVIKAGEYALTKDTVKFIRGVNKQLVAAQVKIESMTLPPLAYEVHIKVQDTGYLIKFHSLGDSRQQSGAYLAAREKLIAGNIIPSEYIDVRLGDKVFYK